MSTAKHTPGPWFSTHRTVVERPVRVGRHFAITPLGGPTLAMLPEGCLEVQQANARLIASAPDLLKALKHVVLILDGDGANSQSLLVQSCRAAIAQAEPPTSTPSP